MGVVEHGEAALPDAALIAISVVLALAAVAVAFGSGPPAASIGEVFPQRQPELAGWLANAFYLNTLYAWLVQHPGKAFGRVLTVVDDRVIDGAVNEVAEDVVDASGVAPRISGGSCARTRSRSCSARSRSCCSWD